MQRVPDGRTGRDRAGSDILWLLCQFLASLKVTKRTQRTEADQEKRARERKRRDGMGMNEALTCRIAR